VTTKYRGVRWHYCNRKWEARIFDGVRQVSLGYFEDELEAARVDPLKFGGEVGRGT